MPGTSSVQDSDHGSLIGASGCSSPRSSPDGACGGHSSQPDDGLRRSCHGSSEDHGSTGESADERGSRSSAGQSRSSGFEEAVVAEEALEDQDKEPRGARGRNDEEPPRERRENAAPARSRKDGGDEPASTDDEARYLKSSAQ